MPVRPDYEMCATCTHSENIHRNPDDSTQCRAYMCHKDCKEFVKK